MICINIRERYAILSAMLISVPKYVRIIQHKNYKKYSRFVTLTYANTLVYLMQEIFAVDIGYRFQISSSYPRSVDLDNDLRTLLRLGVFVKKYWESGRYLHQTKTEKVTLHFKEDYINFKSRFPNYYPTMAKVFSTLGKYPPNKLKMIAMIVESYIRLGRPGKVKLNELLKNIPMTCPPRVLLYKFQSIAELIDMGYLHLEEVEHESR